MIYDRKAILSLKVRSSVQLRKLSRAELLARLQVTRTIEPVTLRAYKDVEDARWRSNHGNSPHGHPWHVSHHASQFPGDNPMSCARQSLYRMMDLPNAEPFNRHARTVMEAGKAIEVELVRTWHEAGILLSAPPDAPVQTGFELPEAWLTGSVDAVIKPYNWNRPVPVEIKTKYQKDIDEMLLGRGPDSAHVTQLKVQLALVRRFQGQLWPGLDPVTHGYIYYLSRDRPSSTAEFRVDYDETFFALGVQRLQQWKAYFQEDYLPQVNASKKHPMGWKWSYPPCQWCAFKKTCKEDFQTGVDTLTASSGIGRARLVRPDYDPAAARARVLARWREQGEHDRDMSEAA
jgi:CRISPR/Cas system-associated exonuclease Cas4 (RecB family)